MTIVAVRHRLSYDVHEANVRLIAAAPDLFAALRDITDRAETFVENPYYHLEETELRHSIDRARAVLQSAGSARDEGGRSDGL